jgi:hypothetical protein
MMDDVTQVAIEQRRQQADTVLEIRSRILEERVAQAAEVDEVSPGASAEDAGAPDPALVRAAGGATSRGCLLRRVTRGSIIPGSMSSGFSKINTVTT